MWRPVALLVFAVVLGVVLVVPRAGAQAQPAQLTQRYADPTCGFSIRYPDGWQSLRRTDGGAQISNERKPPTALVVGPIKDIDPGASPDALASAAAGRWCLDCLRTNLVWIDRFVRGTMMVSYTISRGDLQFVNDRNEVVESYPNGYYVNFFIIEDGTARGLAGNGWTQAEMWFWVPIVEFRDAFEGIILPVVRTFELAKPVASCW